MVSSEVVVHASDDLAVAGWWCTKKVAAWGFRELGFVSLGQINGSSSPGAFHGVEASLVWLQERRYDGAHQQIARVERQGQVVRDERRRFWAPTERGSIGEG